MAICKYLHVLMNDRALGTLYMLYGPIILVQNKIYLIGKVKSVILTIYIRLM